MKPLKRIYIEITNICNLTCSFCPKTKRDKTIMKVSFFESIIKQVINYTDYVYLHVKGEPLLHPQLLKILDICSSYSLKVNITTNGTLLKEKQDLLLDTTCVRQVNISLHSFEAEDNNLSMLQSYLNDIFQVAKNIQTHTNVIISYRLWNLDRNNLSQSVKEQNQYVLWALEQEYNLNYRISDYFLSNNNMECGIKLTERIYLNQSYEFMWPELSAPYYGESGYCHGIKDQIAILADGTVVPCCLDGEGIISLGNLYKTPLSDILSNERTTAIKNGFAQRKVVEILCKHCGYRERFNIQNGGLKL